MTQYDPKLIDKLKKAKCLILDVDGVLTDGGIIYNDRGEETKKFNAKDGLGIRMLLDAEIGVSIVTGRRSDALNHRCKNLGISSVFDGVKDKAAVFRAILDQSCLPPEETAAMGDDLPDLPLLKMAGCSVAVADAHEIVRQYADMVTAEKGGSGAVREVCEAILKSQGKWESAIAKWS
jgi:3-deoxy-D-manno-octulosonate 8-phosphate phosphatase (KDO 8-P phosphatase)